VVEYQIIIVRLAHNEILLDLYSIFLL